MAFKEMFVTTLYLSLLSSSVFGVVQSDWKDKTRYIKQMQMGQWKDEFPNLLFKSNVFITEENITETCRMHLAQIRDDLSSEPYAIDFIDSLGKLPSGIKEGNLLWWGSYDQCTKAQRVNNASQEIIFSGKYCRVAVGAVDIGYCFPSTCSDADISRIVMGNPNSSVSSAVCPKKSDLNNSDIAAIVLCSLLALLLIIGTMTDLMMEHRIINRKNINQSLVFKGVLSFSVRTNLPKVLNAKGRAGEIDCLHGIRVLSLLWVIMGHIFSNLPVASDNLISMAQYAKIFSMQVLMNATVSVDTFFFISGLLVCYHTLKQLDKNKGELNWFTFYFHRFVRLTPVYMFTIMVVATLIHHMVQNGPIMDYITLVDRHCSQYWWTNLIYIQNFYPPYLQDVCLNWTWYLANDMQFYLISPVIIIALYKKPKIGFAIIFLLLVICLLVRGIVAYFYDINPIFYAPVTNQLVEDHHYTRPYYRIAPYLTGLSFGFYLWQSKLKVEISWKMAAVGWVSASVVNLSVLYGLWGYYKEENYKMNAALVVYETFHRWAWSLGIGWLTFACIANKAGWINNFLAWKGWIPLSRLSYSAYLIHIPIICLHTFSIHTPFHFDIYTLLYKFFADVIMTCLTSLVLVMAIESPVISLEKMLMGKILEKKSNKSNVDFIIANSAVANDNKKCRASHIREEVISQKEETTEVILEARLTNFVTTNTAIIDRF